MRSLKVRLSTCHDDDDDDDGVSGLFWRRVVALLWVVEVRERILAPRVCCNSTLSAVSRRVYETYQVLLASRLGRGRPLAVTNRKSHPPAECEEGTATSF